jgi:predicted alpha-1,2-mannosidase
MVNPDRHRAWRRAPTLGVAACDVAARPAAVILAAALAVALIVAAAPAAAQGTATQPGEQATQAVTKPAAFVDPFIGTANGGNDFPGAVVPFGMVQWSPEIPPEDARRGAAPGGYEYGARRIRGFSLTHLSGTGCRGASGDVPFMPVADTLGRSPSADTVDREYSSRFSHANETAQAGYYQVRFADGIDVELTATPRTGVGRFSYPAGGPAVMLVRASDSEVGSDSAHVAIDPGTRTVSGWVRSGNFCGYISDVDRRSYYTLYFVAVFDHDFAGYGTWEDARLLHDSTTADGGTTYGERGVPPRGRGSGAFVSFARGGPEALPSAPLTVGVRVGISYVSLAGAESNLRAEDPEGTPFETVRARAQAAWNDMLGHIRLWGGTPARLTTFYTALYHSLLHPNLASDVNGEYRGMDGKVHSVRGAQKAQYANFSGWDVYRSQLQLVTLLQPGIAGDIAQSLLNQAQQNGGEWDRWTHESGATHVMEGDAAAAAIAGIVAFGGTGFDVRGAYESLKLAATVPTANDSSRAGCPVECVGQRPSLDDWLRLHYIPAKSNAWGGAGETLEDATADFALAQLAHRLHDDAGYRTFLARSGYWRNLYDPAATPEAGYIQDRNADGSWTTDFDPGSDQGFAEGSSAQYTWMVPFDVHGLFQVMGGNSVALRRLDAFLHNPDGSWALTGVGDTHAELDNEPSLGAPWLYLYAGQADRTQATIRRVLDSLWGDRPDGMPGNDDLGEMSSWYVWSALGMYPGIPGRAELLLASPLFPRAVIQRNGGARLTIDAPAANDTTAYVHGLTVDGEPSARAWLPASFIADGGTLRFELSDAPDPDWASAPADAPPSFPSGGPS